LQKLALLITPERQVQQAEYVVRCFKLVPGILYGDFILFYMQLFTATSIKYFAKCRSLI